MSAAIALGPIKSARAIAPLIAALNDGDSRVRWGVAKALGVFGDPKAAEVLASALHDPEEKVRREAAMSLGELGDVRAVDLLIEMLQQNMSLAGQKQAIDMLTKIGDPRACDQLMAVSQSSMPMIVTDLLDGTTPDLRDVASTALRQIAGAQQMQSGSDSISLLSHQKPA